MPYFFGVLELRKRRGCMVIITYLAKAVEETLGEERDEDDDGANNGDDPRRSILERRP